MEPNQNSPHGGGERGAGNRERLVLLVVGLAMLVAIVAAAVAAGLAASSLARNLDFSPPDLAQEPEPARPSPRPEPPSPGATEPAGASSPETSSPAADGAEPGSSEDDGSGRIVGEGVPASRMDMDDGETYLRVTGTEGTIFLGRIDDAETPDEGIKFETETPGEYELRLGDDGLATVYLADMSFFSVTDNPGLKAEIIHRGRVVSEAETRVAGGVLYVGWSPGAPPPPESRPETVTVRVTGEEGMRYDGTIGRGSRTTWSSESGDKEGIPERLEIRGVKGTVPAEHEVRLDLDSEMALANFTKDFTNEVDGELAVELIHDGRVVERTGTGERADPLATSWPAPETE